MTYRPAPVPPGAASAPAIEAQLELDTIGVAQDPVIGMASSAPAETMAIPAVRVLSDPAGKRLGEP